VQTRTWRSWASKTLTPLLARPSHWESGQDWGVTNQVLAAAPTGWLAQGIAYSRTRSKESYNSYAWVAPLYLPFPHVTLSWSLQLSSPRSGRGFTTPGGTTDEAAADALAEAFNRVGCHHLERVGTLTGFRDRVMENQTSVLEERGVFWRAEEVGYTQLLLGRYVAAAEQLDRQRQGETDEREWVNESRERCGLVLELLLQDPARAVDQLAEWAAQTAAALGLTWVRPG
jgi:hypothetical protein